MNNIKSIYLLKDEVLIFISLKKFLQLFKYNNKYHQLFELSPLIYQLYTNIQKDFEPYNENIQTEMFSYLIHISRIQKNGSKDLIIKYYFYFLLSQQKIFVEYNNIYFEELLDYLNSKKYSGTLIINIHEPKLDLNRRPDIEIKSQNFYLEIHFNMEWIDREKKENIEYFKNFLNTKIIGEYTKSKVTKIEFFENLNLNEEKYEDFFFEELYEFPNALFNIQSNYFNDINYWSQIDRFFKLKFIINEKITIPKCENDIKSDLNQISNNNNNIIIDEHQDEIYKSEIINLNKNILSIRELNNFILDFRKNRISIASDFFNAFKSNKKNLKNKNPSKITLINFSYEKNKEHFSEFNDKVISLTIIQRIYKNTPYPFFLSNKLQSLKVLKLERINILEENLILMVNNNPLLEIFEIHKNYTGYIYGYNLALSISKLNFLKSLTTEFFWYKDNITNFMIDELINKQENEFYKFFKSNSLINLSMSNETNINMFTLNENLPNLIHLSIENSNILDENKNNGKSIINNCNSGEIKTIRFSIRNKYKKKMSEKLKESNFNKQNDEKGIIFNKLRDLGFVSVKNCDDFFKKISSVNKIEELYLKYFDSDFFDTLLKYGINFTNLDTLYLYPDLNSKIIKSFDMVNLIKNLHYFEKVTTLVLAFFYINENLVNTLYDELIKLPLLYKLKIYVNKSTDEEKEMLQNKVDEIKNKSIYAQFFTITYIFLDKKFR